MKTNKENKLDTKIIEWLDGMNIPAWISLLFFVYWIVDNTPVIIPITHAKSPRTITKILIYELELILIVKCNEVVKNPTPIIDIAVRIHARKVLSLAKCCCAYFTLSPDDSFIFFRGSINS